MDSFSFVVLGDIQNHNDVTTRMVDLAASLRPDLCVITGDLVNDGTDVALWEKCIEILEPLAAVCEVAAVPGNHDYEGVGLASNFRRFFRQPGELTYVSLRCGGCKFLLLDTILDSEDAWETGCLPPSSPQLQWLRRELYDARVRDESCFVFAHHPIFMPTRVYYTTSPTIRADESADGLSPGNLLPILTQGGAHAFFAGHLHFYERSRHDGMSFVTTGATGYEFPNLGEGGNAHSVVRLETNHLCHVEVLKDAVRCQAIDEWSEIIDEWEAPFNYKALSTGGE